MEASTAWSSCPCPAGATIAARIATARRSGRRSAPAPAGRSDRTGGRRAGRPAPPPGPCPEDRQEDILEHAEPARRVRDRGDRERDDEDAEHDDEAGIAGFRQREIDDRGGCQQLQRADDQLRAARSAGADSGCRARGSSAASGAASCRTRRARRGRRGRAPVAERDADRQHLRRSGRISDGSRMSTTPARKHRRQDEGEPADGDQDADFGRRQPLDRVGAVADDRARQHRAADIVRQRIGGEGAERDEQPATLSCRYERARCGRSRQALHRRRSTPSADRSQSMPRDGGKPVADVVERDAAQFVVEQPQPKTRPRQGRWPARHNPSTSSRAGRSLPGVATPLRRARDLRVLNLEPELLWKLNQPRT